MQTITINKSAIEAYVKANHPRKRMTDYRYELLEKGHIPGYLSGSNLTGKAKSYGASYKRTAELAEAIAANLGNAKPGYAMVNSRRSKVWVDNTTEQPIKIAVV